MSKPHSGAKHIRPYDYGNHESACPLKNFISDFLEIDGLSPQLRELKAILKLLAKAVAISERPITNGFNPVEAIVVIARKEFGRNNPMTVRIEKSVLPFERHYRQIGIEQRDRR